MNIKGSATSITTLDNTLNTIISGELPIASPKTETEENQIYSITAMNAKITNACADS
jgi:hypothetical protein